MDLRVLTSFGSHALVSWPISSNKNFTDSQNYALSGDMRLFAEKWEEVEAVTRKYNAARQKGVNNIKKMDFILSALKSAALSHRAWKLYFYRGSSVCQLYKVHFFNIVYPLLSRGVVFARDSPHFLSLLGKKPHITGKSIILWVRKIFVWRNWSRNKGVRAKTSFRRANKISCATQGGGQY